MYHAYSPDTLHPTFPRSNWFVQEEKATRTRFDIGCSRGVTSDTGFWNDVLNKQHVRAKNKNKPEARAIDKMHYQSGVQTDTDSDT